MLLMTALVVASTLRPTPTAVVHTGMDSPSSASAGAEDKHTTTAAVCRPSSHVAAYDATSCGIPGAKPELEELCDARVPSGLCAFVTEAALTPLALRRAEALGVGGPIVVSGDSMARQALLGLVLHLRRQLPPSATSTATGEPAVEHYFHCDAVYIVYRNGSDRLTADFDGHCAHGSDAGFPLRWVVDTVTNAQQQDALLVAVLVWHQVETIGNRTLQGLAAIKAAWRGRTAAALGLRHVVVAGYSYASSQQFAIQELLLASQRFGSRVTVVVPPAEVPRVTPKTVRSLRLRNQGLLAFSKAHHIRSVDLTAELGGRCDGVHYLCIMTPHVAEGRPARLRAPCPEGCTDTRIIAVARAILDF